MYAVIRTGNKQYRVEVGQELLVEKLDVKPGDLVPISDVLMCAEGTDVQVGTPTVPATVRCLCVKHEKGPKVRTFKYKRRKGFHRRIGHRQPLTRLLIEAVEKGVN